MKDARTGQPGRNDGFEYRETLGADADGDHLLDHMTRRYRHSSREQWRARIESGQVLVEPGPTRSDSRLQRGQVLIWRRPPWEEPDAPTSFTVLHEDDDVLAVAKPAGLPTLPGAGFLETTLLRRVRSYAPEASPAHRLGRWTSGVVLFSRNSPAHAALARQFLERQIGKRYRALASGSPGTDDFAIDVPVGPVPHPLLGSVHAAAPRGRPASTHVVVVERRRRAFLCDVRIATGRPHQIRIHLAAAGHPLVGDPLYPAGGVPGPGTQALPGDPGYHLHAAEITLRHPRTGSPLAIECAPPPELRPEPTNS